MELKADSMLRCPEICKEAVVACETSDCIYRWVCRMAILRKIRRIREGAGVKVSSH